MPEAVYHQASFLSGEWSPRAHGRSDSSAYRTALTTCLNALPVEEGAWLRRCGTRSLGPTAGRLVAKLLPFQSSSGDPFVMEFTIGTLQFYFRKGRVCTNDQRTVASSTMSAGALSLTLDDDHGWSVDDAIILGPPDELHAGITEDDIGPFLNRVFSIGSAPDTDSLLLLDDAGDGFTFTPADDSFVDWTVYRLKRFTDTPWTDLENIRVIQARERAVILQEAEPPQILTILTDAAPDDDSDPLFGDLEQMEFLDGPYLDPQEISPGVLETGSVDTFSGAINFTPEASVFDANDIGRLIRLWSEPAEWNSGTTYAYGDTVSFNNEWWVSIARGVYATSNVGIIPGTIATVGGANVDLWAPNGDAGRWAWGTITAIAMGGSTADVSLETDLNDANGTTITQWSLGVYKIGRYPTCGVYHEGRLWLAGAINNRIDASQSNNIFSFAPTDANGFVADDNAIAAELNFDDLQLIYWMAPDPQGILVGTAGGEILITASQLNDPITPSSRQANKVSAYRCANAEPRRVGAALVFIQRYKRALIEYLADGFTGKFAGRSLNEFAKHLSVAGIKEIAYQAEPVPVVWARDALGAVHGTTYRRLTKFIDNPPEVRGSHRHEIGDGDRIVHSMCVTASSSGLGDDLYLCTSATNGTDFAVEVMMPPIVEA